MEKENLVLSLYGRLKSAAGATSLGPYEIEACRCDDGSSLCRVPSDAAGRFAIRYQRDHELAGRAVQLTVRDTGGRVVGRSTVSFPKPGAVAEVSIPVESLPTRKAAPRRGPKVVMNDPWEPVPLGHRIRLARLLQGVVTEQGARPLVPRALNSKITELNTLGRLAGSVLNGDVPARGAFSNSLGSPGGLGAPPAHYFAGASGGRYPCALAPEALVGIVAAGLFLDMVGGRPSGGGPGHASRAAGVVKEGFRSVQGFYDAAHGFRDGGIPRDGGGSGWFGEGPLDEPVLVPEDWLEYQPVPEPDPGGGGGLPFPEPRRCELSVDCIDEIVGFAESYVLPSACPPEEDIGSLTPNAVCLGQQNVEIEIRPVAGKTFSGTGVCEGVLYRSLNHRTKLEVVSFSSNLVKVKLASADFSGCVGFSGDPGGGQGNVALINTCFKLARITNRAISSLLRPQTGKLVISCTGNNRLAVVPLPVLDSITASGPGGASSMDSASSAYVLEEACRDVELAWRFDFGPEDVWVNPSQFVRVRIEDENGTVVANNALHESSRVLTDRDSHVYTLTAVATVSGQECGRATATVTIDRFHVLRLSGFTELQVGQTGNLEILASCVAPSGGLAVSLASSQPGRLQVPGTVTIPAGQNRVTVQITALGSGCANVTVSASAQEHQGTSRVVEVYDTPTITAIDPESVQTCKAFEIEIDGTCFREDRTTVTARRAGESDRTLTIVDIAPNSLRCSGQNLLPGSWTVTVTSRGLESNPAVLAVVSVAPTIVSFIALTVNNFQVCGNNPVDLIWDVDDTSRVVIRRGNTAIEDIPVPGCQGTSTDSAVDLIARRTTYTLEAHRIGGGATVTASRTVGLRGAARLTLLNNSGRVVVVWKVQGFFQNSADIPLNSPKQELAVSGTIALDFADCGTFMVIGVDKESAIDQGYDPNGDGIQIANLRRYELVVTGETGGEQLTDAVW